MPSSAPLTDFSDDQLNREYLADYLTTFIRTTLPAVNTNSLVLALNSAWGSGKTSFIQMWMNKLMKIHGNGTDTNIGGGDVFEQKQEFNIIYYNAWENDSCPEAIIPIICSFSQLLETSVTEKDESDKRKEAILNTLKKLGPRVLNSVACGVLHVDTETGKEILTSITDIVSDSLTIDLSQSIYDSYSSTQEKKEAFVNLAKEFATEKKPLLIFIDELDRCRPTFAIETLEAVKHFFDLAHVIFVFSLNNTELMKSIKAVYGDIDTVGYLQRFFDYEISLPESNDYRIFLSSRLHIGEARLGPEITQLTKAINKFSLSLRDLNVICKAYQKFLDSKPYLKASLSNPKYHKYREIYVTLIALRYKNPLYYLNLLTEGLPDEKMDDEFWRELFGGQTSSDNPHYSILTKEGLEKEILSLTKADQNSKSHILFNRILQEEDWNIVALNRVQLTLRQAIMNNLDLGVIHHSAYQRQYWDE